jgi:hypothetical protein
MPNITLAVPEELHRRMKRRSDVRWSEIARRAIVGHLEALEHIQGGQSQTSTSDLREMLLSAGIRLEDIPLEKAMGHYRKMRELEWRRISSTRAS